VLRQRTFELLLSNQIFRKHLVSEYSDIKCEKMQVRMLVNLFSHSLGRYFLIYASSFLCHILNPKTGHAQLLKDELHSLRCKYFLFFNLSLKSISYIPVFGAIESMMGNPST
jgi:hypothetical protein